MLLRLLLCCFLSLSVPSRAQPKPRPALTLDTIMQDPKVAVGTSPSGIFWAEDGQTVYFNWNPERAKGDSLYKITLTGDRKPVKVSLAERRLLPPAETGLYNRAHTRRLYEKYGDLFLLDLKTGTLRTLTNTVERESNPAFSGDEQSLTFVRSNNLFQINVATGAVTQLTNFDLGNRKSPDKLSDEETVLKRDQLALFDVLRDRKARRDETERSTRTESPRRPKPLYTEGRSVVNPVASPDGRFVTFSLSKPAPGAKATIVPGYVTESGFTEPIPGRTKVGTPLATSELLVYDTARDTALVVGTNGIPGITDVPDYLKDYPKKDTAKTKKPLPRAVTFTGPFWSDDGKNAVVVVRAVDNKDRWIMALDAATRTLKLLDRQRDEAWVGGPGISGGQVTLGWLDNQTVYFQSEATGYAHLYTVNVVTGEKKQLTSGNFEVQQVQPSRSKTYFYLTTNEVHPGEQHFYRMAATGGERTRLTTLTGASDVTLSPDETKLAIRYSAGNQPWELYLQEITTDKKGIIAPGAMAARLTNSTTDTFNAYPWRNPDLVTIPARDGQPIYARLYKPALSTGKTVIFVHGAGYLQNAHKWWSQYFREYMFHNLLCDKGYTVLDIDYRGSAGYGRNWRTGIYRHMGGKDLTDQVDAVQWLVKNQGVDPKRMGIYGGSYGGFITLMAMFTTPDQFKAGAALRPVTDWAAYNHGYTANILNEPQTDSLAYHRSSPIFFADGLKGHLLICHGMVDVNVHVQDAIRLSQRLIELKKENWQMALYPVEDHGFVEPTSWLDEYRRILKLFDDVL